MAANNLDFEEELALVEQVDESEHAEIALRTYLLPLVQDIVRTCAPNMMPEDDLVIAGYTYFDFAVHRYLARAEILIHESIDPYKFSSYFIWFARQGVLSYLEEGR